MNDLIHKIIFLHPQYNANGVLLADSTHIICKCSLNHVHKYTHENAIAGVCVTCNAGTTKSINQRLAAEKILEAPFILNQGVLDIVYYNAKLHIMLKCGETIPDGYDDYKIVDLYMKSMKETKQLLSRVKCKRKWSKSKLPSLGLNI
jgi:hypothetical protein